MISVKIELSKDEVELTRNKRKGLKLKIKPTEHLFSCGRCFFRNHGHLCTSLAEQITARTYVHLCSVIEHELGLNNNYIIFIPKCTA